MEVYQSPGGPGIRLDGVVYQGYKIPTEYDSLLVKLTIRSYNWEHTIQRLKRALNDFLIVGPKTTIPFYLSICDEPDFRKGMFNTSYLDTHPEIFDYPEQEREIAKLSKLIAEIHSKKINPYAIGSGYEERGPREDKQEDKDEQKKAAKLPREDQPPGPEPAGG